MTGAPAHARIRRLTGNPANPAKRERNQALGSSSHPPPITGKRCARRMPKLAPVREDVAQLHCRGWRRCRCRVARRFRRSIGTAAGRSERRRRCRAHPRRAIAPGRGRPRPAGTRRCRGGRNVVVLHAGRAHRRIPRPAARARGSCPPGCWGIQQLTRSQTVEPGKRKYRETTRALVLFTVFRPRAARPAAANSRTEAAKRWPRPLARPGASSGSCRGQLDIVRFRVKSPTCGVTRLPRPPSCPPSGGQAGGRKVGDYSLSRGVIKSPKAGETLGSERRPCAGTRETPYSSRLVHGFRPGRGRVRPAAANSLTKAAARDFMPFATEYQPGIKRLARSELDRLCP
jgi:hypothetical protein